MNAWKTSLLFCTAFGSACLVCAQEDPANVNQPTGIVARDSSARLAPLGLPRLRGQVKPGEAAPLAAGAFAVDSLAEPADEKSVSGRRTLTQNSGRVIELDAEKDWERPLQQSTSGVLFVSFSLYGSPQTEITVGGARLGIIDSPIAGNLQLMVGEPGAEGLQWRPVGLHFNLDTYRGRSLADLPVLTVRLDPTAGIWDLYFGSRQLADGLALNPGDGRFLVHAGSDGAWVCGLVQSADNPLFEDANGNGIDDAFEREKLGQLLARDANSAARSDAAKQWRDYARTHPPAAWLADRPRPDRLAAPLGKGSDAGAILKP